MHTTCIHTHTHAHTQTHTHTRTHTHTLAVKLVSDLFLHFKACSFFFLFYQRLLTLSLFIYWHLLFSSQNFGTKAKCWLCWKFCVRITLSWRNLYDVTNSARPAGDAGLACTTVCTGAGQGFHTRPSHPTLDGPQLMNARKQRKHNITRWLSCVQLLTWWPRIAPSRTSRCLASSPVVGGKLQPVCVMLPFSVSIVSCRVYSLSVPLCRLLSALSAVGFTSRSDG